MYREEVILRGYTPGNKFNETTLKLTIFRCPANHFLHSDGISCNLIEDMDSYFEIEETNLVPSFNTKLKAIEIKFDLEDIKKGEETFVHELPSIVDMENDLPIVSESGLNAIPCKCVELERIEDKYYIKMDKTQATAKDCGTYTVTITL